MQFLHKYRKKYGSQFWIAAFFVTIEAVCDLLQPTIMANIIDVGVATRQIDYVLRLGGFMLLVTATGAISATTRNIVSSRVSQSFAADLRADLYEKIQTLSFTALDKLDRASLVTRITNDVNQVQNFITSLMRISMKAPLLCTGGLIMAINLNPRLAVVLAAIVPVIIILIIINMKIGFPRFFRMQRALDRVNGVLREYLSGVRVVKAFNRFDYEQKKFAQVNDTLQADSVAAMRVMAAFAPGIILTFNLGIIAVLWLGGLGVSNGHVQVGQVIAFINYMMHILFSLIVISMVFNMLVRARASVDRIGEVFAQHTPQQAPSLSAAEPKQAVTDGKLKFTDVSFSYGQDRKYVLENINFDCNPGELIGIIGATGSGKSSLVHLICRFYDPTTGFITIDNQDITTIAAQQLRDKIAIVPQTTILFTGTILDNIKWGKKTADKAEIEAAAKMAEAHTFIMDFPQKYETKLGQNGVNLSGGQKQRLAIARALVRQPDILILDDCTSAVDAATEARIKKAIRQYATRCTCIIIAQRITSVMDADKIIVLDNGRIVDQGKHAELLDRCTVYQEIYQSQFGKEIQHGK